MDNEGRIRMIESLKEAKREIDYLREANSTLRSKLQIYDDMIMIFKESKGVRDGCMDQYKIDHPLDRLIRDLEVDPAREALKAVENITGKKREGCNVEQ